MLYVEHWSRLSTGLLDMQLFNLRIDSGGIRVTRWSGGSATSSSLLLLLRHMRSDLMLLRWWWRSEQRLLRVISTATAFAAIIVTWVIDAFLVLLEMKKGAMESTTLLAFV